MKHKFICIFGPTGTGKSALAIELARQLGGEIVNCDSIQLYQGFDIGSAKPSTEERALAPHHLFDILQPTEGFDAAQYTKSAQEAIRLICSKGSIPIVVGGTGLYLRALLEQRFDQLPKCETLRQELSQKSNEELMTDLQLKSPQRASELHLNDRVRLLRAVEIAILTDGESPSQETEETPSFAGESFNIRISIPRESLLPQLKKRSERMVEQGLVEEVLSLKQSGVPDDCKPMQSIGYRQVLDHLLNQSSKEELIESIFIATRQYAKKQETWFKKSPHDLHLHGTPHEIQEQVQTALLACKKFQEL